MDSKTGLGCWLAGWRDRMDECIDLKIDIWDDAEQSKWDGHWHNDDWTKVIGRFHY
jgi:hypothetical protein